MRSEVKRLVTLKRTVKPSTAMKPNMVGKESTLASRTCFVANPFVPLHICISVSFSMDNKIKEDVFLTWNILNR